MRNGVVVEEGPTAEIFERPRTSYTKALLAAALDHRATNVNAA
jgi:microcin C transport system ATP-binding protein